jgi:hypothetical protein
VLLYFSSSSLTAANFFFNSSSEVPTPSFASLISLRIGLSSANFASLLAKSVSNDPRFVLEVLF